MAEDDVTTKTLIIGGAGLGLMEETEALPDAMPLDQGVKMELPEESIR